VTSKQRRIDGLRLAAQAVVIVVSVLTAFGLDRWWEARRSAAEERQVLIGLQVEFRDAKELLGTNRSWHEHTETAVAQALRQLRDARARGQSYVSVSDTLLAWTYVPPTTGPILGTLEGLISSGRLGILRDRELRTALASWGTVLQDLTEDEVAARDYVTLHLDPTLRSRADVTPFRIVLQTPLPLEVVTEAEVMGKTSLPTDLETIGVLAGRLFVVGHAVEEFGPVQRHVDRILTLISKSLDRYGERAASGAQPN